MKKGKSKLRDSYLIVLLYCICLGFMILAVEQIIISEFWKKILSNIAATLFISGGFGLIDQYFLKEKLVQLILDKIQLKEQISKTGIEEVFLDINDIDYKYYLKEIKKNLDIVHVYGRSWTTSNIDILKDKILNSNCSIRVVLLSPESSFINGLAYHYDYSEEKLKESIIESAEIWKDIYRAKEQQKRKRSTSKLEVYYHKGMPANSLYRIDDRVILVTNKLAKGRTTKLVSMVIKNTKYNEDLFSIYLDQIDKLILESELVNLDNSSL